MGKFDRFEEPKRLGHGAGASPSTSAVARVLAGAERTRASGRSKVAIALDATGSMTALIAAAKQAIAEIVSRASHEAKQAIEIELFAFRDYDLPNRLLDRSGVSGEPARLTRWLGTVRAAGGGANDGEAVEAALGEALAGDFAVVLLMGDEPSNSRASLVAAGKANDPSAHDLARSLGERRVPVHCFAVGQSPQTVRDYAEIARLSGGKSGQMDGSKEMIDLAVMAILASLRGSTSVRTYMAGRQLTANTQTFGRLLLGER